jgi:hypothetical protein
MLGLAISGRPSFIQNGILATAAMNDRAGGGKNYSLFR